MSGILGRRHEPRSDATIGIPVTVGQTTMDTTKMTRWQQQSKTNCRKRATAGATKLWRRSDDVHSPIHPLHRFAHAQPAAELVEFVAAARVGTVQVRAFG